VLRTPMRSADMPQVLRDATVAIEDQRFYKHKGVDFQGILRAAVKDITSGQSIQGGSTITMQLVHNLYLPTEARNFKRKITEAKLAEDLESRHPGRAGKLWILTNYLNTVAYGTVGGQSAIGVAAAARIFFNEPVSRLTLSQAALLAGLPQAPSEYNPFGAPETALARRNDVLTKMAQQHYITAAAAARAEASPLGVHHTTFYSAHRESYFFDYVKQQLIDEYGPNRVQEGGLKVYSTIDLRYQDLARKAIAGQLNQPGDPSSAIVTIDPRNGYIRAMASSATYGKSEFNLASQGHRQPGSTFKVMVLMTAVRKGIDPATTTYNSHPLDFVDPRYGPIKVQTYSHTYSGNINLVQATLQSDNTVYEQLDLDVGPAAVAQTAHDMGVTTHLDGYPAEGLGGLTIGVSPLEMANAYATIADGGWRNKPIAITRVVFPGGHTDDFSKPERVKAFSDGVTSVVTKILQQNIQSGTGVAANIGCPAGGKTGTVDNFTDAWFDGFTPHLSTAVWVGYPTAKIPMTSVHGIAVAGGTFPAMIWHDYMASIIGGDCSDFPAPTQPVSFSPFFSSLATTGAAGSGNTSGTGNTPAPAKKKPKSTANSNKYPKQFYAAPPQPPPAITTPAPPPSNPGNGKGKGGKVTPGNTGGATPGN
jgi:penicillin-binding protein 1A